MTNEKQETISDIVREMRTHGRDGEFVNGYEVARLADRIEAAAKRETLKNALAENERLREATRRLLIIAQNRLPNEPTLDEIETLCMATSVLAREGEAK